jgi:hypothetical protein
MLNFRKIIIYVMLLGMEVSWLYAVLNAANKSVADRLSIPLLVATLLISFLVSKAFRYLPWPKAALTALSWLVWPIVMLLMVKVQLFPGTPFIDPAWLASIWQAVARMFSGFEPALLILLSTIALWWLGRRLAYARVDFSTSVTEFQFGLVILVIVFFTAYELNLNQSSSLPVGMAFFGLALLGISISHSEGHTSWSGQKTHWPGILILTVAIILLLGLLISLIITPDLIQLILRALGWVWGMIMRFLSFIISLLPQPSPEDQLPPQPSAPAAGGPHSGGIHLPEWLTSGGRIVWAAVFLGLILFAIYRLTSSIFAWMRRRSARGSGEVETLEGALWADLINWFRRIISRIFGINFSSPTKDKLKNMPPEIASVRQLYTQVLRWGKEGGHPRQKSQTANEYQSVINEAIAQNHEELDFITREYNNARYGVALPGKDKLEQLKLNWHNLKRTVIRSPQKKKTQSGG